MTKISLILFLVAYLLTESNTQTTKRNYNVRPTTLRPGVYVPKVYGDDRGRYRPDDRGKYKHVDVKPVPYQHITIPPVPPGGYFGNGSGLPYQNKYFPTTQLPLRTTTTKRPIVFEDNKSLNLGPKDHLRFMLDFNFNDGGWQIVQFDWNHDDESGTLKPKYNYVNERKLFDVPPRKLQSHLDGYFYGVGPQDRVHLDGLLNKNTASYNFTESNPTVRIADNANIRETIGEVLDYVKRYILPKLS